MIKMVFKSVEFDIVFCQMDGFVIKPLTPEWILGNRSTVMMDMKSRKAFRGRRDNDYILSLFNENDALLQRFRDSVCIIKFWAKQKGIYSSIMGFLGGVCWTILVVRICLMFRKAEPSQIVRKFFEIYSKQNWDVPLSLTEINYFDFPRPAKIIRMQIITPTSP